MKNLNKKLVSQEGFLPEHMSYAQYDQFPERIIQFGEGNFIRAFVDWMIHETNKQGLYDGRIVVVQPIPYGNIISKLNEQDGLYTLVMQGIENNKQVEKYELVSSISRGINPYENWEDVLKVAESPLLEFVFSNTTEAGLTYVEEAFDLSGVPHSYPGKLTAFLYHRFCKMDGKPEAGLTIIPCELVDGNGKVLKEIVMKMTKDWDLPEDFVNWINDCNRFCNTLVDRIVPGFPKDNIEAYNVKLGYKDELLTVGEVHHLFVIDAGVQKSELIPFQKAGLNVIWDDVTQYRQLKVSLLNAPHTMMFPVGLLAGANTVYEYMEDEYLYKFAYHAIFDEIIPLLPFDEEYKLGFSKSVLNRFRNPFFKHQLQDIGLNGVSKFKTRVLPLLLDWVNKNERLPEHMIFSFASLITYFKPVRKEDGMVYGVCDGKEYQIRDDEAILNLFDMAWEKYDESAKSIPNIISIILSKESLWGQDLTKINGLIEQISIYVNKTLTDGMKPALKMCLQK